MSFSPALTQHGKESILDKRIAAENANKVDTLAAQILDRSDWYMKNKSVSEFVAKNMATYDFDIGEKMRENFTIDLVIDSDVVPPPGKGRQKWVRKNSDKLGSYFYDPYDGTVKKIIMDPNDPNKKNLAFETFDAILPNDKKLQKKIIEGIKISQINTLLKKLE